MKSRKQSAPVVTSHADHDVIVPPNRLRKAWSDRKGGDAVDPVARAEEALAGLSKEFAGWMETECARLEAARLAVREKGLTSRNRAELFHAAHDIRGEAETLGYPLAAAAADSLCVLIEETPEEEAIPPVLIERHVDAVKAIVREHALPNAEKMAKELTEKLRALTDDFLDQFCEDEKPEAAPPMFCKR